MKFECENIRNLLKMLFYSVIDNIYFNHHDITEILLDIITLSPQYFILKK